MTHVSLVNLSKAYQHNAPPQVNRLTLEVESGRLTALLGPSGSGKTTVMKMIAGLLDPSDGDILFDGVSVRAVVPEQRGAVMVFQNYLLFPHMTIAENVGFGLKMRGMDKHAIRRRVSDMLELVRLPGVEQRRPWELSGGQQQRVALARALIIEPKVLLLDEPLSNLDAHLRDEMRDLIRSLQQSLGITTLFVTHDQEEAVILADRIALMFNGILQQYDAPSAFYERPTSIGVARFFGGVNFIPGRYHDQHIETAIGSFAVAHADLPAGDAVLSIRPEAVLLGEQERNTVRGRLQSHLYAGTHTRCKISVGGVLLEVITDPAAARSLHDGDEVTLHFPADKIWLLPPRP